MLNHSIFVGVPSKQLQSDKIKEVGFPMSIPLMTLAFLCVLFGVFAFRIPLKGFIYPALPKFSFIGYWQVDLATLMVLTGIILGFFVYWIGHFIVDLYAQDVMNFTIKSQRKCFVLFFTHI